MTVVGGTERKGPYECSHTEPWKAETQESELGGLVNEVTNPVPSGQAAWRSSKQPHSVKYSSLKPVAWEQIGRRRLCKTPEANCSAIFTLAKSMPKFGFGYPVWRKLQGSWKEARGAYNRLKVLKGRIKGAKSI